MSNVEETNAHSEQEKPHNMDHACRSPSTPSSPVRSLEVPSTPLKAPSYSGPVRNNCVTQVMLHGVPIVCLFIDGKERLCLAQISNTLLKEYSYNEIHNRRVALGITCVQCTPVQLEILRRAGAMPISSRRCGMITHREAERLVKSFLEENTPPKLPESFYFKVVHNCGWGCTGHFEPSRYNSSRAKCIKCTYCNSYFSPNKFIFHFHRTPESKYNHPDAANFNSWRRHLKLITDASTPNAEQVIHAWEDVKAMFNGGNRKRVGSSGNSDCGRDSPKLHVEKKPRLSITDNVGLSKPMYPSPYSSFPMLPLPGKSYPFGPLNHSPPFGLNLQLNKDNVSMEALKSSGFNSPWSLHNVIPTYNMFWNSQLSPQNRANIRSAIYPLKEIHNQDASDNFDNCNDNDSISSSASSPTYNNSESGRFSAFRLVKRANTPCESLHADDKSGNDSDDEINITDCKSDQVSNDDICNERRSELGSTEFDKPVSTCDRSFLSSDEKVVDDRESAQDITDPDHQQKVKNKNKSAEKDSDTYQVDHSNREIDGIDIQSTQEKELDFRGRTDPRNQVFKETIKFSYTNELEQQLQIVRESLTNELEQERQIRYALQQKLKEAHDALHSFSCKMLASRQCQECAYKEDDATMK